VRCRIARARSARVTASSRGTAFTVAQTLTAVSLSAADFTVIARGAAELAGHARCF
jgi:hypothetical protein